MSRMLFHKIFEDPVDQKDYQLQTLSKIVTKSKVSVTQNQTVSHGKNQLSSRLDKLW